MFQPILPMGGLAGWAVLSRTYELQTRSFNASPAITRDTDYFVEKIGEINTAEELVADRRLLRVALGAYGLEDDINSKAFLQKILEGGVINQESLANKLADDRYKQFAKAFGFELGTPNTKLSDFPEKIVDRFRRQQFEVAIGEQDQTMRFALNADRMLEEFAAASGADDTKWFRLMGNAPLRKVMETALGLPESIGKLDIDRQLEDFKDRAARQLGGNGFAQFADKDARDAVVQRYLARAQVAEIATQSTASIAISLLENSVAFAKSFRR